MRRTAWWLPGLVLLAAGACFLTAARALDKGDEAEDLKAAAAAAPDVQKLTDAAAAGDAAALKKQADDVSKKYELKAVMWAFKPKDKGGFGVTTDPMDKGIELKLIGMGGKKALTAKDLPAQTADLQRMAAVIHGIAEATPAYAGKFTKTPAEAKTWTGLAEDMAKGADELSAALKAGGAKAVQKAANDLSQNCNDCHEKFRDN